MKAVKNILRGKIPKSESVLQFCAAFIIVGSATFAYFSAPALTSVPQHFISSIGFILAIAATAYCCLQALRKRQVEATLSRALKELQNKQSFCESIFQTSRDCIKVLDLDCKLIFMNGGGQRLLEICDFAPLKGANWLEFWAENDRVLAKSAVEKAKSGGVGQFTGYFPTTQSRIPKWFDVIITAMRDGNGKATELLVVSRDVTATRKESEELKSSELQFKILAETIPQIVWTSNPDGNLDYYNQHWFDYTGMTLEQTKGWGWEPVLHPDDLKNCVERWTQAVKTGRPYEVEYRFKRAMDGEYRWHLGRANPIRDERGSVTKWFGTCTDIHEQKEISNERAKHAAHELARLEVTRANEFLDQIIENIPAMILIKNAKDLTFVRLNKAGEEFTGYTQHEILGKSDYDFLPKEEADFLSSSDRAIIANGGMIDIKEHQIKTKKMEHEPSARRKWRLPDQMELSTF